MRQVSLDLPSKGARSARFESSPVLAHMGHAESRTPDVVSLFMRRWGGL